MLLLYQTHFHRHRDMKKFLHILLHSKFVSKNPVLERKYKQNKIKNHNKSNKEMFFSRTDDVFELLSY